MDKAVPASVYVLSVGFTIIISLLQSPLNFWFFSVIHVNDAGKKQLGEILNDIQRKLK